MKSWKQMLLLGTIFMSIALAGMVLYVSMNMIGQKGPNPVFPGETNLLKKVFPKVNLTTGQHGTLEGTVTDTLAITYEIQDEHLRDLSELNHARKRVALSSNSIYLIYAFIDLSPNGDQAGQYHIGFVREGLAFYLSRNFSPNEVRRGTPEASVKALAESLERVISENGIADM